MSEIDPLLARQLKRAGVEDPDSPPDAATWRKVVARISDHYKHTNDDRVLITRSLELSTKEMEELHRTLAAERDRLRGVVGAIGDALNVFRDATSLRHGSDGSTSPGGATGSISYAKRKFADQIAEIFPALDGSKDAEGAEGRSVIGDVRTNFLQLADQLASLLAETAAQASMKEQLEIARAVQRMLVPSEHAIERSFLRVAGHFQPAAECSGDWWTAHDLPDGRVLTVIGDVTGHGVSSAIITGAAKAACDLARTFTGGRITPGELLEMMNCSIYEAGKQRLLMTCVAAIFDSKARTVTVANAGHSLPYHVRQGKLRQMTVHGSPLGASATSTFQAVVMPIEPADALLFYTDGLTECENEAGEQFGERRLRSAFLSMAQARPEVARQAILDALNTFRGERQPADDITFLIAGVS